MISINFIGVHWSKKKKLHWSSSNNFRKNSLQNPTLFLICFYQYDSKQSQIILNIKVIQCVLHFLFVIFSGSSQIWSKQIKYHTVHNTIIRSQYGIVALEGQLHHCEIEYWILIIDFNDLYITKSIAKHYVQKNDKVFLLITCFVLEICKTKHTN